MAAADPGAAAEHDRAAAGLRLPSPLHVLARRLPCRTDIPELRQIGDSAPHETRCHYAEELAEAQVVAGAAAVEEGR